MSGYLRFLNPFTASEINKVQVTHRHRICLLVVNVLQLMLPSDILYFEALPLLHADYKHSMTATRVSIHFGKRRGPILFSAGESVHSLFGGLRRYPLQALNEHSLKWVLSDLDLRAILGWIYKILDLDKSVR